MCTIPAYLWVFVPAIWLVVTSGLGIALASSARDFWSGWLVLSAGPTLVMVLVGTIASRGFPFI